MDGPQKGGTRRQAEIRGGSVRVGGWMQGSCIRVPILTPLITSRLFKWCLRRPPKIGEGRGPREVDRRRLNGGTQPVEGFGQGYCHWYSGRFNEYIGSGTWLGRKKLRAIERQTVFSASTWRACAAATPTPHPSATARAMRIGYSGITASHISLCNRILSSSGAALRSILTHPRAPVPAPWRALPAAAVRHTRTAVDHEHTESMGSARHKQACVSLKISECPWWASSSC